MNEENFQHVVYSKNVLEFVTVSNEYCTFLESIDQMERGVMVERTQKILTLLYLKASLLPKEIEEGDGFAEKFVQEDDYEFLLKRLRTKLGQHDVYQEVFDAEMMYSDGALDASIAENLTDIYQDLKDFILSYRIGSVDVMEIALWECKNNFETYWGQKLVNGLRAIHNLLFGDIDLDEKEASLPTLENEKGEKGNTADWILREQFKSFQGDEDDE